MKKIFALLMMFVGLTIYGQQQKAPLVTVTGTGTVNVVPDEVVLQARVSHEGMNAAKVKQQNDQVVDAVIKYLRSEGVEDKNIKTTYVNLNKNYDYQSKTYSYAANQSISIHIKKIDDYEKIVTGLLEKGLNRIDGIQFKSSEIEKHKEEARKKAVLNAKEKANIYATALGQQIGAAYQISELENNNYQPVNRMEMMKSSADSGESETIAPGEMEVAIKVNVAFYLHNNE